MSWLLSKHPITTRLYGWGTPTCAALGVGGVAFAAFVGALMVLVLWAVMRVWV